jgi:outer membrane protein assembly factor BamB
MFARMRRRWRPLLALVLVAVLATIAGAAVAVLTSQPGDVTNPDVEFEAEEAPTTAPREPAAPGETNEEGLINWPEYGLNPQRTKFLPLSEPLRPPFTFTWAVRGSILLEFPPVAGGKQLFLLKNNGALYGISRKTGEVRWKRKLGYLAASSPAYANKTVYVTLLQRGKGIRGGRVVAINPDDGRTKWSRKLASRSESSPVYENGNLYFGSEDGTVYGLRASDGYVRWRYRAGGAVKAALALDRGRLFFGDYNGKMHAIRASNGSKLWVKGTEGARFGLSSGNFYSTPAVAYGRVYIGNTDGNVYSFGAKNGKLAWRKKTGGYVYSSPALAYSTVYIGSYDKKLYALDAQSGRTKWTRKTSARISGGPAVLGDLVFVSNLGKRTYAFGARTGNKVWETNKGAFNPVIGDGERVYLVGYASLFAMKPRASAVAERRKAVSKRVRDRAAARHERYLKDRYGLHGHKHTGRGDPPRCHEHKHVHRIGSRVIVVKHNHCHKHVPRD